MSECIICFDDIKDITIYKECGHYICGICFKKCIDYNKIDNKHYECQSCRQPVSQFMTNRGLYKIDYTDKESSDIESQNQRIICTKSIFKGMYFTLIFMVFIIFIVLLIYRIFNA